MRWDMDIDHSKIEQMMGHALPGVTGEHYDKPTAQAFIDTVGKAFHINLLHKNDCTQDILGHFSNL